MSKERDWRRGLLAAGGLLGGANGDWSRRRDTTTRQATEVVGAFVTGERAPELGLMF